MAEKCKTECVLYSMCSAALAIEPLVAEAATRYYFRSLDEFDAIGASREATQEASEGFGKAAVQTNDEVKQRGDKLRLARDQREQRCVGPQHTKESGGVALRCAGFNIEDVQSLLAQNQQIEEVVRIFTEPA